MSYKHDKQVGGSHYDQGDKPQHWDLAIMYGWDAFQYQITKYVMRWKSKHATKEKRLEDLKKARSFLDKYIENFEAYDPGDQSGLGSVPPLPELEPLGIVVKNWGRNTLRSKYATVDGTLVLLSEFEKSHAQYLHNEDYLCEGGYGDGSNLYRCKHCRTLVRTESLQEAARRHGSGGGCLAGPTTPA